MARLPEGGCAMVKNIAEQENIPSHFLAKILQELARQGFLRSTKGPSGGFSFRVPARELSLLRVIEALDGKSIHETNEIPWVLESWRALHSRMMGVLGESTISSIARALDARESAARQSKSRRPKKK